jgi:hypothetical protein
MVAPVEPTGWLGWTGGLLGARKGMPGIVVRSRGDGKGQMAMDTIATMRVGGSGIGVELLLGNLDGGIGEFLGVGGNGGNN